MQKWEYDADYNYNPTRAVALSNTIVFDEGPNSIGAKAGYASSQAYYRAYVRSHKTTALNIFTGKKLWAIGDNESGLPLFSTGGCVFCLTMSKSQNDFFERRQLVLNEISGDGNRKGSWVYKATTPDKASELCSSITFRFTHFDVWPDATSQKTAAYGDGDNDQRVVKVKVQRKAVTLVVGTREFEFKTGS